MGHSRRATVFITEPSGLAAARLIVAPPFVGCLQSDAVLSNIRLRGTGFRFDHPTLEHGLRQVLGAVYE